MECRLHIASHFDLTTTCLWLRVKCWRLQDIMVHWNIKITSHTGFALAAFEVINNRRGDWHPGPYSMSDNVYCCKISGKVSWLQVLTLSSINRSEICHATRQSHVKFQFEDFNDHYDRHLADDMFNSFYCVVFLCLFISLFCLFGWLAGWLVGWLVGWLFFYYHFEGIQLSINKRWSR